MPKRTKPGERLKKYVAWSWSCSNGTPVAENHSGFKSRKEAVDSLHNHLRTCEARFGWVDKSERIDRKELGL